MATSPLEGWRVADIRETKGISLEQISNLTKLELCAKIKEQLPQFVYVEAPIGEDPDKRDYIVLNEKIEATGFRPAHSLDAGITELIKGYAMLKSAVLGNV